MQHCWRKLLPAGGVGVGASELYLVRLLVLRPRQGALSPLSDANYSTFLFVFGGQRRGTGAGGGEVTVK